MNPDSLLGIITVIGQITQAIYTYGDAVLEYKTDVARLRSVLFGMQAALTQIEQDLALVREDGTHTLASPNLLSAETGRMLDETGEILRQLAETLKPEYSKTKERLKRLVWPLKKSQVQELVTQLERLKSFFILAATNDTLQATRDIQLAIRSLHLSIEKLQKSSVEDDFPQISKWLAPRDTEIAHKAALANRLSGTGSWFLEKAYWDWVHGSDQLLWLNGAPGSGKTCIAAACVDKALNEEKIIVYFYCTINDATSRDPRNIIGSFLIQLAQQQPNIRSHLHTLYDDTKSQNGTHNGTTNSPKLEDLINLVLKIIDELGETVLMVVDALDEGGDSVENTLNSLFQLLARSKWTKLMLSSQKSISNAIQAKVSGYKVDLRAVSTEDAAVGDDINVYINDRFLTDPKLKLLRPELRYSVISTLQKQHVGSFRWARCTMDDLVRRRTPRAIKEAMDGVAPTLGDIYSEFLKAVPIDMESVLVSGLQFLVSAKRQLTLPELAEAVSFTFSDDFGDDDRLIAPEAIVPWLYSLVHYDASSQRIELAHSSVQNFLTSRELAGKYYVDPLSAGMAMSQLCVEYLSLPAFRQTCSDQTELETRKKDWPLFEYASFFWTRHIRDSAKANGEHLTAVTKFAATSDLPEGGNFAAWYQCVYPLGDPRVWLSKPLYMCAREGIVEVLKILLATCTKDQLEERGGARGSTALHVAATYGEAETVKLLLAAGADPHEQNNAGESGIHWAAYYNHSEVIQLLLEAGVSPSLLTKEYKPEIHQQMAKHMAIWSGKYTGTEKGKDETG